MESTHKNKNQALPIPLFCKNCHVACVFHAHKGELSPRYGDVTQISLQAEGLLQPTPTPTDGHLHPLDILQSLISRVLNFARHTFWQKRLSVFMWPIIQLPLPLTIALRARLALLETVALSMCQHCWLLLGTGLGSMSPTPNSLNCICSSSLKEFSI